MINVKELLQAEALIREIDDDAFHPANDKSHRDHKRTASALRMLKSKAAAARALIEHERYFHK